MIKLKNVLIAVILLLIVILIVSNRDRVDNWRSAKEPIKSAVLGDTVEAQTVDKVQVYYFHRTQRCNTCKAIGRYTGEVINETFIEEQKRGRIEFREINVELPENKELAKKFKASGPSLFMNIIKNGQDNIIADANIWRLVGDEESFKKYLAEKIKSLL